jgi:hypothetical protein
LFDAVFVTARGMRMGGPPPRDNATPREQYKPLDPKAREDFAKLPDVVEVYPQIRFLTDVRYGANNYSTNVLGLPESSRTMSAFDGITGAYFSSPTAAEAILQMDFAKQVAQNPQSLIGQDITLRKKISMPNSMK